MGSRPIPALHPAFSQAFPIADVPTPTGMESRELLPQASQVGIVSMVTTSKVLFSLGKQQFQAGKGALGKEAAGWEGVNKEWCHCGAGIPWEKEDWRGLLASCGMLCGNSAFFGTGLMESPLLGCSFVGMPPFLG